ncbi:MAG: flagellar biosynthesis protein FlhB [Deltaproteobacteria bacterium]|nr:flagellar biosynthesis protein FlhB [Deltaproteobacteria bacterium]
MAENINDQEKTEQATPKRREDARRKGKVAKSREVASVAILSAGLVYFYFSAGTMLQKMTTMMRHVFSISASTVISVDNVQSLTLEMSYQLLLILLPLLLIVTVAGLAANMLQVGVMFSSEAITPKWSKVDPIKGFQRLFSLQSIVELVKNILKMLVVGFIAYLTISREVQNFFPLMDQDVWGILSYIGRISFKIVLSICWVLIILAIADYLYQRWEHERSLKMTKQEVKEEYKHTEGDPLVKSRIRRLQREIARKRMMAAVPKADVVITNPTHIAVALRYDHESMVAPTVIAKGSGYIAEKIKEVAAQNHVPVVENKPLAQVLNKMVDINGVIPENLYRAVAEVLAYVYGRRNLQAQGG